MFERHSQQLSFMKTGLNKESYKTYIYDVKIKLLLSNNQFHLVSILIYIRAVHHWDLKERSLAILVSNSTTAAGGMLWHVVATKYLSKHKK